MFHPRRQYAILLVLVVSIFSFAALVLMIFLEPVSGFERISVKAFVVDAILITSSVAQRPVVRWTLRNPGQPKRIPIRNRLRAVMMHAGLLALIHA